jgi:hypothetical protein
MTVPPPNAINGIDDQRPTGRENRDEETRPIREKRDLDDQKTPEPVPRLPGRSRSDENHERDSADDERARGERVVQPDDEV